MAIKSKPLAQLNVPKYNLLQTHHASRLLNRKIRKGWRVE